MSDIQPCECGAILDMDGPIIHCWMHHVDEPTTDSTYRRCMECFHSFATRDEVEQGHAENLAEVAGEVEPGAMTPAEATDAFCPLCLHDWM